MSAIFVRAKKDRHEGGFVPDSFFRRFGEDTASVSRGPDGKLHVTTYTDIGRRKKGQQRENVTRKTASQHTRRAGYLWVFHCPGAFGFAFAGWWAYLVWIGGTSDKHNAKDIERWGMNLFPMPDLFPAPQKWAQWFAKTHQHGSHCGKPQGKAFVWIEFEGARIKQVTSRGTQP
jgi:hypothetical protein